MNQKKQNTGGRGCLFLVAGTVLILALMALYIFAVGRITASVVEARSGDTPAYAVMSAQIPCIIVAFVLLECVLMLQYLPSQEDYEKSRSARRIAPDTAFSAPAALRTCCPEYCWY